jgi:hypothetical protein
MQVYGALGVLLLALGALPFARYSYFVLKGESNGHLQSLVIGAALWVIGGQMFITGMLATAIGWNRRMLEEALFRMKSERAESSVRRRSAIRRLQPQFQDADDAEAITFARRDKHAA